MDRLDPERGEREAEHGADEVEAAEAFEALRAEVAGLRRELARLDGLVRQGQREQAQAREEAPDYSPTLGEMAKALAEARQRLAAIEGKPALGFTPGAFGVDLAVAARTAVAPAGQELREATARANAAADELRRIVGSAHDQFAQQRREWTMLGIGAALGFVFWWPLAWGLPWGLGERLASTLIAGEGRWGAGVTLLHEADPQTWSRLVRLYQACPQESGTEACEAALAVKTPPQAAGQAPAGQPASAPAPQPAGPRGKGPQSR